MTVEDIYNHFKKLNDENKLPRHFSDDELMKIAESEYNGDHASCPLYVYEQPQQTVEKPKYTGHGISYNKNTLNEFRNPQNINWNDETNDYILKEDNINIFKGSFGEFSTCGDQVDVWIKLSDDHTTIEDMKYLTTGCIGCITSCSKSSEYIKGVKISEFSVKELSDKVQEYLQLPEIKHHCSSYAGAAINLALKNVQN